MRESVRERVKERVGERERKRHRERERDRMRALTHPSTQLQAVPAIDILKFLMHRYWNGYSTAGIALSGAGSIL